ncbi:MAG: hypothetical protein ACPL7E_05635 [bacterium]
MRSKMILLLFASLLTAYPQDALKTTLYGTLKEYFVFGKGNPATPYPANIASPKDTGISFCSYPGTTTLGLSLEKGALEGNIEADFEGDNCSPLLLKAYISIPVSNNTKLVIGRADPVGELNSFSDNYVKMPGFNPAQAWGVDQFRLEMEGRLGKNSFNQAVALGDLMPFLYGDNEPISIKAEFPALSYKFSLAFPSSLKIYSFYEFQKVSLSSDNIQRGARPYVFGLGFQFPLKKLQIQGEVLRGKGTTFYSGAVAPDGSVAIPSGYRDVNTPRKFHAGNLEAFLPINQKASLYTGYAEVEFSGNICVNEVTKATGCFLGMSYDLDTSTTLKLELDRFGTRFLDENDMPSSAKAQQLVLSVEYNF